MNRFRCTVTITFVALAASLLVQDQAHAGQYVIRNCNVPGYATAPITPWTFSLVANVAAVDNCASGGGFGLTLPGARSMDVNSRASMVIAEPDGLQFQRIRLWLVARLQSTSTGSELHALAAAGTDDYEMYGPSGDYYRPGASTLDEPLDLQLPDDISRVTVFLRCLKIPLKPPNLPCSPADEIPLEVRGAEITLTEDGKPQSVVTGGTLLVPSPVSGVRTVEYKVSDAESGIATIEALVGDVVIATKSLSASCSYSQLRPCPPADEGALAVDTRRVSDGTHPLILRTTDAAGNQRAFQVQLINVQNVESPSADVGDAQPTDPTAKLEARFVRSKRASLIVPFGRKVTVRGRLTVAGSTSGPAHARIEVLQRSGRKERRVGTVKTRANGTFTYRRRMRGPTRTMRFVYRAKGGSRVAATSPKLKVRVRARAALRVSLRGRTVRYSGRVLARPLPTKGKQVRVQGRTRGFAWATFAKKRTDRRGRFSGTYRLPVRRPGVQLQIRVWVPGERGYRYLSYRGSSKKLRVR